MSLAFDISNYTGPVTAQMISDFQATQVSKVIVQAVDPPNPPYPPGVTAQQIQACRDAGLEVEAYIYLWNGWPDGVDYALRLLDNQPISRIWLDVEDISAPVTVEGVGTALAKIIATGRQTGIYTAKWYWPAHLNFSSHPLWVAQYDGLANLQFDKFGGWERCVMKQYTLEAARAFGHNYYGLTAGQLLAEKLRALALEAELLQ